jgi:hypothetical protein
MIRHTTNEKSTRRANIIQPNIAARTSGGYSTSAAVARVWYGVWRSSTNVTQSFFNVNRAASSR